MNNRRRNYRIRPERKPGPESKAIPGCPLTPVFSEDGRLIMETAVGTNWHTFSQEHKRLCYVIEREIRRTIQWTIVTRGPNYLGSVGEALLYPTHKIFR